MSIENLFSDNDSEQGWKNTQYFVFCSDLCSVKNFFWRSCFWCSCSLKCFEMSSFIWTSQAGAPLRGPMLKSLRDTPPNVITNFCLYILIDHFSDFNKNLWLVWKNQIREGKTSFFYMIHIMIKLFFFHIFPEFRKFFKNASFLGRHFLIAHCNLEGNRFNN